MQHFRDNARSRQLDCKPAHLLSPVRPARAPSSSAAVERFCATRIIRCTHPPSHLPGASCCRQLCVLHCCYRRQRKSSEALRFARSCDFCSVHPPRLALTLHPSHHARPQLLQPRKSRSCALCCHLRRVLKFCRILDTWTTAPVIRHV